MILCGDTTVVKEDREGKWAGSPAGRTLGGRRKMAEREYEESLRNNQLRSLGPEGFLSEVGTLPPHDLDTPHKLVVGITTKIYRNNRI